MQKYLALTLLLSFSCFAQIGSSSRVTDTDKIDSSRFSIIEILKDLEAMTTGAWTVPSGTDAQRPGTPAAGMLRYNSEQGTFEGYTDEWGPIAGGGGGVRTWADLEEFVVGELVFLNSNKQLYRVITAHTAGPTFTGANFEIVIKDTFSELMLNPSFENTVDEVTVTNATAALVANNFHGTQALQCTGTGASARCCVVVDVPAQRELIRHEVSCNIKTADTGVEFTLINNGVNRGFYEVVSNNEWTAYSFLADATDSIGFCIDQEDTDVTLVDNCSITSNLSKRAAVDCANEFDCVNEFSAKVSATGVISDASPIPWLTCTNTAGVATCTYESGLVTSPMNCTAIVAENSQNVFAMPTLSATGFVFQNNSVGTSRPFSVQCIKTGSDYKTIPERGVINVNMDAQNDTDWKAYTPTFQGFGTPTDVSCFFKKNGANADISCAFVSGTPTGVEARVGLPSGLVISDSIPNGNFSIGRATRFAGGSAYEKNLAVLASVDHTYVGFSSINQASTGNPAVRLLGTEFMGAGQSLSVSFSVPIQGWSARQEIVVDISETRYVSGGAEVKTVNTWDGEPIFRRDFELASDISTSGTVIATIPTGLSPIGVIKYSGDFWSLSVGATGTNTALITYNQSTGSVQCFLLGTAVCGLGTKFSLEYLK